MSTFDYLATTTKREFRVHKSDNQNIEQHIKRSKAIFEQILSMQTLYKSRPRFGPESCNECQDYLAILRPIEHFLDALDNPLASGKLQNFGPSMNKIQFVDTTNVGTSQLAHGDDKSGRDTDMLQLKENELVLYKTNLNKYLDERQDHASAELTYSESKLNHISVR